MGWAMKKMFRYFRTKKAKTNSNEIPKITSVIGPLVENLAKEIFTGYSTHLVNRPLTYIVPGVWGASAEGELSVSQKEIFLKVSPVVEQIIAAFAFEKLNDPQKFALGYLIRGLLISKITFMIEASKNRALNPTKQSTCHNNLLHRMETIGSA
jgi:hypothetical protein